MREKELRIALVCFGGVSLAVYMHGISKEILKLVRASRALHAIADRGVRLRTSPFDTIDRQNSEYDTEAIYFELLREIGRNLELRVIVDIIAGASAGGINGTMLARALCHDLPMGGLRQLWLDNADVTVLLAPEARAGTWNKWLLKPLIWGAARFGLLTAVKDLEVRKKLSLFVRSRWFKPPLDGHRMAELMYDAAVIMGAPATPTASLLPSGHCLDLYVTLTDHYGYQQLVQIHDPPLICEREHHQVLHFGYRRSASGEVESDFDLVDAPALAFAARATSSFPGAFPPARIVEIDQVVAERQAKWPHRDAFIARNFSRHLQDGIDPARASFIDGSVLNNRPFREAISAIHGRPAFREVDRRLVYIDPDPAPTSRPTQRAVPGFFATLKGAISDIPRNQPVTDELNWVIGFNDQIRQLRTMIEEARPEVSRLVASIITVASDQLHTAEQIRAWREQVNARVARDAGFAYRGYVRLKLASVRAFVARLIIRLCDLPPRSPAARWVADVIDAWAVHSGLTYFDADSEVLRRETMNGAPVARWAQFFLAFDVEYRKRRLHFLIEGQNRLYQMLHEQRFEGLDPGVVDRLKRAFYEHLDVLYRRERPGFFSSATRDLAARLFSQPASVADPGDPSVYARAFVEGHIDALDQLVDNLACEIDLKASTHDVDVLLSSLDPSRWDPHARHEVLVNYLGFPFWDVLTFSVTTSHEAGELHEILIDRISPQDARTLDGFNGPQSLKGIEFGHFAAFLSRRYRENDYLLGRLHALDRLIDIVCDCAGIDAVDGVIDINGLKKRAFTQILDAEAGYLIESSDLIAALREQVAAINHGREPSGAEPCG